MTTTVEIAGADTQNGLRMDSNRQNDSLCDLFEGEQISEVKEAQAFQVETQEILTGEKQ